MGERYGAPFTFIQEMPPLAGCTISSPLVPGADVFVLDGGTDISEEIHPAAKLIVVLSGSVGIWSRGAEIEHPAAGEACLVPAKTLVGMKADEAVAYIDIAVEEGSMEKSFAEAGSVFRLADLVPYRDGAIVNRDILKTDTMKLVVMAFDEGCALDEHAAPGEAVLTVLEGTATVVYEGEPHLLEAGKSIRFAKGGRHAVKAEGRFKMALAVTLG